MDDQFDDLYEILDWPLQWSALHGIAEVKIPIAKIVTRTDATAFMYVIRWEGRRLPESAARGLNFPYFRRSAMDIKLAARQRVAFAISSNGGRDEEVAVTRTNGFSSVAAMKSAHEELVTFVSTNSVLRSSPKDSHGLVLDLGCGDGALLERIGKEFGITPAGVDVDADSLTQAKLRFPNAEGRFLQGDVLSTEVRDDLRASRYDLVCIAQNRFDEVAETRSSELAQLVSSIASEVLLYSYDGRTPSASIGGEVIARLESRTVGALLLRNAASARS